MGGAFSLTVGVVLLLIAFVLYLLALKQVPHNPHWPIDRVTTAQCLVVLWLLLTMAEGVALHNHWW